MLAIAGGGAEDDSDNEDDEGHNEESQRRCERGREANDHSSIDEHIFEHLPPRVHKGADNRIMIIVHYKMVILWFLNIIL